MSSTGAGVRDALEAAEARVALEQTDVAHTAMVALANAERLRKSI